MTTQKITFLGIYLISLLVGTSLVAADFDEDINDLSTMIEKSLPNY